MLEKRRGRTNALQHNALRAWLTAERSAKKMTTTEMELRAAAQIALLGEVPPSLRSVSLHLEETKLLFRAILASDATEEDQESLSCTATEILASLSSEFTIDEEILCFDGSLKDRELSLLVFRRKEAP